MSAIAKIKVLAGAAFAPALSVLGSSFERASGSKLEIHYDIAAPLRRALRDGDAFDLAILDRSLMDYAVAEGKVDTATAVELARIGMAVAVQAGTPRPDIATLPAFKKMLVEARSLAFPRKGSLAFIWQKYSIASLLRMKWRPRPSRNCR